MGEFAHDSHTSAMTRLPIGTWGIIQPQLEESREYLTQRLRLQVPDVVESLAEDAWPLYQEVVEEQLTHLLRWDVVQQVRPVLTGSLQPVEDLARAVEAWADIWYLGPSQCGVADPHRRAGRGVPARSGEVPWRLTRGSAGRARGWAAARPTTSRPAPQFTVAQTAQTSADPVKDALETLCKPTRHLVSLDG